MISFDPASFAAQTRLAEILNCSLEFVAHWDINQEITAGIDYEQ